MTMPLFGAPQEEMTSDDYYTPSWVFEALGLRFDLDVAAPPGGVEWIPADRYFTKEDDGLAQPWEGRVWMNPPFSNPSQWVQRFTDHGNGVALLPVSKSAWFDRLWNHEPARFTMLPPTLKFAGGSIFMPVLLVALGESNIAAIGGIGRTR